MRDVSVLIFPGLKVKPAGGEFSGCLGSLMGASDDKTASGVPLHQACDAQ
jgi:hypothetical protein